MFSDASRQASGKPVQDLPSHRRARAVQPTLRIASLLPLAVTPAARVTG
jgi:hypothetical protein